METSLQCVDRREENKVKIKSMVNFSISGEKIFEIFGFEVTNTFFLSLFIAFLLTLSFFVIFKKGKVLPTKIQNFLEWILESFFNFFHSIVGSKERTEKIFPLAITLFIFILCANLVELLPGMGVFKILRSPSSDLNFTLALTLFSLFYINFLIVKEMGILNFLKRFVSKNPLFLFVGFMEFLSEITRILSLSFRLYGNLLAGKVLLTITSFFFVFLLPLPFLFLELFVSFIQAFIFSFLIVIYYSAAFQAYGEKQ